MKLFDELLNQFLPEIVFFGMIFTFIQLFLWATNKKTGALIFGILLQLILPAPNADTTINIVKEDLQTVEKEQKVKKERLSTESADS